MIISPIKEESMINNYSKEAHERWGNTDAYLEHEKKTKNYTKEKWAEINEGLMSVFAEFAECKNNGYDVKAPKVQSLVGKLREYITQNYYTCTNETLAGLGKMYACDERFKKNIDKNGDGTAEFVSEAICIYFEGK